LYDLAAAEGNDPARCYVVLRNARDLAAQAGEPALALKAADGIASRFRVDGLALRLETLGRVRRAVKKAEDARELTALYLDLADAAVDEDRFETASEALAAAATVSRKARDRALSAHVKTRKDEVKTIRTEFKRILPRVAALANDPDDPEANLTFGRFLCVFKRSWNRGLPLLRKGADSELRSLADRDLEQPEDAGQQMGLGDAWWELAQKSDKATRRSWEERAAYWYERVLPTLQGLDRQRIVKRLSELTPRGWPHVFEGVLLVLTFDRKTVFSRSGGVYARDLSGLGNDGRILGNARATTGAAGAAVRFDGTDDAILIEGFREHLIKNLTSFSLSVWVKSGQKSESGTVFDVGHFAGTSLSLVEANGEWDFSIPFYPTGQAVSAGSVATGWHHLACTWRTEEQRIYLDGVLKEARKPTRIVLNSESIDNYAARIGGRAKTAKRALRYYKGLIDEVAVWGRALSQADVTALYLRGLSGQSLK